MKVPSLRRRAGRTPYPRLEPTAKQPLKWEQWELLVVCGSFLALMYLWFCYENFHFHITHFYAHLGYPNAQHLVGQRYLRGVGVQRDEALADHWFSRAVQNSGPMSGQQNRTLIM
ncbi:hypothetical protein XELAEV_18028655mg [Xenopus laevis]|uniref:Uncharacterized protein n=1 Tax=Xenopus laevis TaxID=8355 RepID=A0A974CQU3_XENLA|nr:hypothetical protein XELAEV_18028655mg [Xenopus laevis]